MKIVNSFLILFILVLGCSEKKPEGQTSTSVKLDPVQAKQHYDAGRKFQSEALAGKLDLMEKALAEFNSAIQLDPNQVDYYFARGVSYREKQAWDQALADFEKTIAMDPKHFKGVYNLGRVWDEKGNTDKALEYYQKAALVKPDLAPAYYSMGLMYGKKGMMEQEGEAFKKAIKLDGTVVEAHYNLGLWYIKKGQSAEAKKELEALEHLESAYADRLRAMLR